MSPSSRSPLTSRPLRPALLRFSLLALLFVVQGLTIIGVLASERSHTEKIVQANAGTLMHDLVARASDSTRRYLAPAVQAADLTRTRLQYGQLPLNDDARLEGEFLSVLCTTPEVENIYLARPDGSFVLMGRDPGHRVHGKRIVLTGGRRQVRLSEWTCTQQQLSAHVDPADTYDPRVRPWYRAAAVAQALVWTDPYVFFAKQIPGVTAAVALRDVQGHVRGIVGTDVALSALTGFLTRVPFSAHGAAVIGTAGGLAVAYPGIETVFGHSTRDLPRLMNLGRPVQQMYLNVQQGEPSGLQTFRVGQEAYYGLMQPLDIGHGRRWLVGVHAPASDFNGEVRAQYRRMQLTALAVGLLGFLLALPLLFRLNAPLQRLLRFGLHFQHAFHFTALLSRDGTLLEVNDAALRATLTPAREALGRRFWTLPWWQPVTDDAPLDPHRLEEAVRLAGQGDTVRFGIGLGRDPHDRREMDLTLRPVLDTAGRVAYVAAEGRDITEQQHLERSLRESEARLRTVLDGLDEGVLVQDAEGRLTSFNARAAHLFGGTLPDIVGHRLTDSDWEVLDTHGQPLDRQDLPSMVALRRGEPQSNVVVGLTRPRQPIMWLSVNARLLVRPDETLPFAVVSSFTDITDRRQTEARLAHQAQHDPLTGLPNRTLFQDRLRQALTTGRAGAVAFLDLDHFKAINDSLGHDVGDQLLRAVAERVTAELRPGDTVARMGGDEFTLILTDLARPDDVTDLAARLLATLERPFALDGEQVRVSASLGFACFPRDGHAPEDLLRHADTAMYHAKASGKNAARVYSTDMQNHRYVRAREYPYGDLQQALDRHEFVLHYQPIYDLHAGTLVGLEALLRWQHPERGLLGPEQFLPALETSGLIHPAGRWVLQQACREAAALPGGRAPISVAVNVSALQFERPDFVQDVRAALLAANLPPERLELELTEGLLMNDPLAVIERMHALQALGVRLSIDDFGTGYSSLSALRRLPVDRLKIDRSFVHEVGSDRRMVQAILSLARTLNLEVIAEGVESGAQLDLLRALGCDRVQGYHLSRAVPAHALPALLGGPALAGHRLPDAPA